MNESMNPVTVLFMGGPYDGQRKQYAEYHIEGRETLERTIPEDESQVVKYYPVVFDKEKARAVYSTEGHNVQCWIDHVFNGYVLRNMESSEWDGWDEDGCAAFTPPCGVKVRAYIDAHVNGVNGPKARWVDAVVLCGAKAPNGGSVTIVVAENQYYYIGPFMHIMKPGSKEPEYESNTK